MNLSFWLNRLERQVKGSLKEPIFYLHVPKCGGTSLRDAISSAYDDLSVHGRHNPVTLSSWHTFEIARKMFPGEVDPGPDFYDDVLLYPSFRVREMLLFYFMSKGTHKFISGHFGFSDVAYEAFRKQYAFVTMLREPVAMWKSAYFYLKYRDLDRGRIQTDIDSYLRSPKGQRSWLIQYVGGANVEGDYTSREAIERAKENLHKFDLVGILEDTDDFVSRFEKRFGVPLKLARRNESPASETQRGEITPEIEERIREVCQADMELYQYAREAFLPSPSALVR